MLKGSCYRAGAVAPPPTSIQWRTDLATARLEAQHTDTLVLVDFSADWCPPCVVMKHDVWPDDSVEGVVTASYIPLLIDVDRDGTVESVTAFAALRQFSCLTPRGRWSAVAVSSARPAW